MGGARERVRYTHVSRARQEVSINWRNEHGCSRFIVVKVTRRSAGPANKQDDFDYDLVCPRLRRVAVLGGGAQGDAAMIKVLLEDGPAT